MRLFPSRRPRPRVRPVRYYPFAGFPVGHPTVLRGGAEDIAGHCARIMQKGCDGCDLLAYRAAEDEPLALVRAARQVLGAEAG